MTENDHITSFVFFTLYAVFVEFDPTAYTVTEGVDAFAELTLIRSGHLIGPTIVTVSPLSGTAIGK